MPPDSFNNKTTAEEAATLFDSEIGGKTVLVTGASPGGLGGEVSRVIARHGAALVILAGRNQAKLDEMVNNIKIETPTANLRTLVYDQASLMAVRQAAAEVNTFLEPIDVLINNGGMMLGPYRKTVDGFESQFATNHLGPFLFTNLIRPRLLAAKRPRVVNVASTPVQCKEVYWDDIGFSDGNKYNEANAYFQSKSANILFTTGIADRWKSDGVLAFTVHPGGIFTKGALSGDMTKLVERGIMNADGTPTRPELWKSIEAGTSTHIVGAFDPSIAVASGAFLADAQIASDRVAPGLMNQENAARLWKVSEEMVGEAFP